MNTERTARLARSAKSSMASLATAQYDVSEPNSITTMPLFQRLFISTITPVARSFQRKRRRPHRYFRRVCREVQKLAERVNGSIEYGVVVDRLMHDESQVWF